MLARLIDSLHAGSITIRPQYQRAVGEGNFAVGHFIAFLLMAQTRRILRQFGPAEPTATKGKGGVQCQHHHDGDDDHHRHGEAESSREVTQ